MVEVAAKMGESVGNARHHYYRGLARLRAVVRETAETTAVASARQEALDAKP
jgi:DNA-directed RNA polymerase specialized sigma24 family protein